MRCGRSASVLAGCLGFGDRGYDWTDWVPLIADALSSLRVKLLLVQFVTKLFDLVFDMQSAALQVSDLKVIPGVMQQSLSDLVFEALMPPFQVR